MCVCVCECITANAPPITCVVITQADTHTVVFISQVRKTPGFPLTAEPAENRAAF